MQQSVATDTAVEQLNLPTELYATSEAMPEAIIIAGVTWQIDPANMVNDGNSAYDPQGGTYCFTPLLPTGYTVAQGVSLPEIYVLVGAVNTLANSTGAFTVIGGTYGTSHKYETNTLTIMDGTALTISTPTTTNTDKIVIGNNVTANITLDQVGITFQDGVLDETDETKAGTTALALGSGATLHLALIGTSNLQSGFGRAGIYVPADATINIQGSNGTLNVTGGFRGAGIGGDIYSNAGTINIAGGTINATSNSDGAAIGGGHANDNQNRIYGGFQAINITGGTVTAKTSGNAAGIGTGCWSKIDTGTIHIENAVVYASTAGGHQDNAAIGRGIIPKDAPAGMDISIANSFVCAKNIKGAPVGTATITNSLVSRNGDSSQS